MLTDREVVQKARNLISDPKNWTQQAYARDERGASVPISSKDAVCFCTLGAIRKVLLDNGDESTRVFDVALNAQATGCAGIDSLVGYNDYHTHEEVLNMLDCAIEKL